ncbi:MAG: serine O-acetyltransferase EpsC, partial [Verrucomicrobiales bacterium]
FPDSSNTMDCEQEKIVAALLDSYSTVGGINHIDRTNLPSKRAVASICESLLQLLFPGFHDEEPVASTELQALTASRIEVVMERLEVEISKSLGDPGVDAPCEDVHAVGCTFMRALPDVRRLLRTDVEAAYEGDPAAQSFEEIILAYPCIEAIAIQRLAHIFYAEQVRLLARMMTEWAHGRTGIDIHPGARIGSHFFIDHGTGVVIGETCVIGAHVKLYHGVTLGARSFPKDEAGRVVKGVKRHPNVEQGVTIYPNATILGGKTTIGARSTVGANAYLRGSIPENSLVAIEPVGHKLIDKGELAAGSGSVAEQAKKAEIVENG